MPRKQTGTKRKPREVRYRARVDPKGTYVVHLPLEIGKKLGGGGEKGRIPVRVTIDGVPCYSQLRAESSFDEWEMEYTPIGFSLYLNTAIRKRISLPAGKMLDLVFVREEHTLGQRGRPISQKILDQLGR